MDSPSEASQSVLIGEVVSFQGWICTTKHTSKWPEWRGWPHFQESRLEGVHCIAFFAYDTLIFLHHHSPAAALQGSRDYDGQLRGEGVEQAKRNLLLASQALAQCSVTQDTLLKW